MAKEWRLGGRDAGADLVLPGGERLESLGRWSAGGTRAGGAAERIEDDEIVHLHYGELDLWLTAEVADRLVAGPAEGDTRGGFGDLPEWLERFRPPPRAAEIGAEALLTAFARLERAHRPHALVRAVRPGDRTPVAAGELDGDGPILVLLHGIFGTPWDTFRGLGEGTQWGEVTAAYGGRVVAFGHPTASVGPVENLTELLARLPAGATVDLLCHSRGGLLADLLVLPTVRDEQRRAVIDACQARGLGAAVAHRHLGEVDRWIRLRTEHGVSVRRTIRVGTPASGSPFAGQRLKDAAAGFQFVLSLAAGPIVDFGAELLVRALELSTDADRLEGYAAMDPAGWLVPLLRTADTVAPPNTDVVGWTEGGGLLRRLRNRLAAWFQQSRSSDLVVPCASMTGGVPRRTTEPRVHRDPDVNHLTYFRQTGVRDDLRAVLGSGGTRGEAAAGRPRVWFVPGVGGSGFAVRGPGGALEARVWPTAPEDGIAPVGDGGAPEAHPWSPAAAMLARLATIGEVTVVPWDWRRPPDRAAWPLEPGPDDVIVAHGHGAWLAADLPGAEGRRMVLLGAPAAGEAPEGAPGWCAGAAPPAALGRLGRALLVFGSRETESGRPAWDGDDGVVRVRRGAAHRFVLADHAELVADPSLAERWIRWLATGADLLPTHPVSTGPRPPEARGDRLTVAVELGFPTDVLVRPLLVGRFENEPLGLLEHSLDRRLDGRLRALFDADAFPGAAFTHHVDLHERVTVFGLGRGDLSEPALRDLVRVAATRLLLAHDVGRELQVVLPDTAARRLPAEVAARAVVEGLLAANHRVPDGRRVDRLVVFAVYEDDAQAVATELVALEQNPRFAGCTFERAVRRGTGSFGRRPDDRRARGEYDVVQVEAVGDHSLRYEVPGRSGALRESLGTLRWDTLAGLLQRIDGATSGDAGAARFPELPVLTALAFPADLRRRMRDGRGLLLRLSPGAAAVPWEVLLEPDGVPIGVRRAVVRQWADPAGTGPERPEAPGRRVVVLADPEGNLSGARAEGRRVQALFEGAGWPVEAIEADGTDALGELVWPRVPRVLHVACHGMRRIDPDDPASPVGLRLGDGLVVARELVDLWDEVPAFVFLNACYSGAGFAAERRQDALALRADFARDLHLLGVRALVVAAWQVRDGDARRFAEVLYERLLAGRRLGDAAREARGAVWRPDDVGFGAWQVWGDPDTVLDLVGSPTDRLLQPVDRLRSQEDVEAELTTVGGLARFLPTGERPQLLARVDAIARRVTEEPLVDAGERGEIDRRIGVAYRTLGDVREAARWLARATDGRLDAAVTARFHALDLRSREAFAARSARATAAVAAEVEAAAAYFGPVAPAEARQWLADARARAEVAAGLGPTQEGASRHAVLRAWAAGEASEDDALKDLCGGDDADAALAAWRRLSSTAAGGTWEWQADWADLLAEVGRLRGTPTPRLDLLAAHRPWHRDAPRAGGVRTDAEAEWAALRRRVERGDGDPDEVWEQMAGWAARNGAPPGEDAATRVADEVSDVRDTIRERWPAVPTPDACFPGSIADLVARVRKAAADGASVRVVGAARSMSEVSNPTSTRLLSLARCSGAGPAPTPAELAPGAVSVTDGATPLTARALYRCSAGRSVDAVVEDLLADGRSPINLGSGSFQGIFAAVTTGTHGSGLGLPPLVATVRAVTWLDLDATGAVRLRRIQPASEGRRVLAGAPPELGGFDVEAVDDDDLFDTVVMSLGCAGVALEVVLEVLPQGLRLSDHRQVTTWSAARALLDPHTQRQLGRHVELQVNPHADASGHHACQVVLRRPSADAPRGHRPLGLALGRVELAKTVIGWAVERNLKRPEKLRDTVDTGFRQTDYRTCAGAACPDTHYVDDAARVLLLNLKYRGLGAEWAVPIEHAERATEAILGVSRAADAALQAAGGSPDAWRTRAALTAVVTLRFTTTPPWPSAAGLAMTAGPAGSHWCVFEIGMLGAPGPERDPAKRDERYAAFVEGRVETFRAIDAALVKAVGGDATRVRPHWGLFHAGILDRARARATWGGAFDRLEAAVLAQPAPLFSNAFTAALWGRPPS